MAVVPRLGETFARAQSRASKPTAAEQRAGASLIDRGAPTAAEQRAGASLINRGSGGGGSSSAPTAAETAAQASLIDRGQSVGGVSTIRGTEELVTPSGQSVGVIRRTEVTRATSPVASAPKATDSGLAVSHSGGQRPYSERLDERLATTERGRNYLVVRTALNEAGLPASTTNRAKIGRAIEQYYARRGGVASSVEGGVLIQEQLASQKKPEVLASRTSAARSARGRFSQEVVSRERPEVLKQRSQPQQSGLRVPQNIFESIASETIISGALGIQPAPSRIERQAQLKADLTKAGFSKSEIQSRLAMEQGGPVASGLTLGGRGITIGATARGSATNFVDSILGLAPQSLRSTTQRITGSRAIQGVRPFVPDAIGLSAIGAGTFAVDIELEGAQQQLKLTGAPLDKEGRLEIIREFQREQQFRAFGGQLVDEQGKKTDSLPQYGDVSLLGDVQRFVTPSGAISDLEPELARTAARRVLEERKIPITTANVESLLSAGRRAGRASVAGQFLIEAGNELFISSSLARTGGFTKKVLGSSDLLGKELGRRIVPRQVFGGLIEGATQTYSEAKLTQKEPELLSLGVGAAFGGFTSGVFGVLQSRAVVGKFPGSRTVTGLGYAIDFPGEPIGDLAVDFGARLAGRERPVLRIPIISGPTVTVSQSRVQQSKGGKASGQGRQSIYDSLSKSDVRRGGKRGSVGVPGLGRVAVDEFGLPVIRPGGNVPGEGRGEGKGKSDSTGDGRGEGFSFGGTSNVFGDTFNQTLNENVNVSSTGRSTVNSIVNVSALTPRGAGFPPLFPPGRLGGGAGGGKRSRLGYFDEFSTVFGSVGGLFTGKRPGRPPRVSGRRRGRK